MLTSGMSKGFRADGEARGDSQPMYDQHGNLIWTLLIRSNKISFPLFKYIFNEIKKIITTSRSSSPL